MAVDNHFALIKERNLLRSIIRNKDLAVCSFFLIKDKDG